MTVGELKAIIRNLDDNQVFYNNKRIVFSYIPIPGVDTNGYLDCNILEGWNLK